MMIAVGTLSNHKLQAVADACAAMGIHADIVGVKTVSVVNDQPVGFRETLVGATSRAVQAEIMRGGDLYIGIESGIINSSGGAIEAISIDIAVIVIRRNGRTVSVSTSTGVMFPEADFDEADIRGFAKTTVGSVIAERTGCDGTDPHAELTGGKFTRRDTLVHGIVMALSTIPKEAA
jgi:non-canonical (house-cleaning) NTP pyrophosphatase